MAKLKLMHLSIFIVMILTLAQGEDQKFSRKLDETIPPDLENKCGSCPCNNPCNTPLSPPPPSPPPPSPPPPPNNPPPTNYCPPPPSGGSGGGGGYTPTTPYIYINGPPGNVYPVDSFYSGSGRSRSIGLVPFLISCALALLAFF